jgi:hypothetical protein
MVAAGFGAAFAIGSATADSDRGEVGKPDSLRAFTDRPSVPTLERVAELPGLRGREETTPEPIGTTPPDGGSTTTTTTTTTTQVDLRPIASFATVPNPALTDERVEFDAEASNDPDGGPIKSYQWDLDGNGTYDPEAGTTGTASKSYPTAGSRKVRLQVTDDEGTVAAKTLTVEVKDPTTK